MASTSVTSYTPTKPIVINYCGLKDSAPEKLTNIPPILVSKNIQFKRNTRKEKTITDKIPEIKVTQTDRLVFYEKLSGKYKKVQHLDSTLSEIVKRNRPKVIYAFIVNVLVENEVAEAEARRFEEEEAEARRFEEEEAEARRVEEEEAEARRVEEEEAEARRVEEEEAEARQIQEQGEHDRRIQEEEEQARRIQEQEQEQARRIREQEEEQERRVRERHQNVLRGPGLNSFDEDSDSSDATLFSNIGMSPTRQTRSRFTPNILAGFDERYSEDESGRASTFMTGRRDPMEVEELPDISTVKWKPIDRLPNSEEVLIDRVQESELTDLLKVVQEVKKEEFIPVQDGNLTNTIPQKLGSEWSALQLKDKFISMKNEMQDLETKREMSEELLTLLCLISGTDCQDKPYLCIKENITPSKQANLNDFDSIFIFETDPNMTLVSVLKRDEDGDFDVKNILTDDKSKVYFSTLLIKDICDHLRIKVNFCNPNCEKFEELDCQDESKPSIFFTILLTVRKMLGFGKYFSLNEVDSFVNNISERFNTPETASQNNDTDFDWYLTKEENKRIKLENEQLMVGLQGLERFIENNDLSN